ncbi:hypothetical protein SmJEL517_g01490 [Synchytrium microbalum]|uniref:peptidylprolyl isomerase n=1 Tax=Synchytrium microbalum TaxID=1806994 RepID=A0A507CAJ9_9FUNG|nr:uncharacterized protein SmJEL517_g01490 [Synchytrium microbalum]TPX36199.1 hypothetical protein SmJEL517_g01490 [Synchytrium microbalum]
MTSNGFFGLVVQPGKTYEQITELPLRLTMASIGPDDKKEIGTKRTYLNFRNDDQDFTVCSLAPNTHETQVIEMLFEPGQPLTFFSTGDCAIHLTGHYMDEDNYPVMDEEEDDENEEGIDMGDEEIDSDEAGDVDEVMFGKAMSKKALIPSRKSAMEGDDDSDEDMDGLLEEDDEDDEADIEEMTEDERRDLIKHLMDTAESDDGLTAEEREELIRKFVEGNYSSDEFEDEDDDDEDDDEETEEIDDMDIFRLAAGVKRKAESKPIPIPPAGKKAKLVELTDATEVKKPEVPVKAAATSSAPASLVSSDAPEADKKTDNATSATTPNSATTNGKKTKAQKKAEKKQQEAAAKAGQVSAAAAAPAATAAKVEPKANGVTAEVKKDVVAEKPQPLSAKAVAKQQQQQQAKKEESGSPKVEAKAEVKTEAKPIAKKEANGDVAKPLENGDAAAAEKQPKKKTLPSGLQIEDILVGKGARAKPGKQMSVRYIGKLASNGKVFDSNTKGEPFKFQLGKQEVIRGWDVGLQGMSVGGTRKIVIPPALAYGSKGAPPDIPSNATLEFEIKLLDVGKN